MNGRMVKAMVPVEIDGWTLFAAAGAHWMRDLDLATRATLKNPWDIKSTIRGLLKDGILAKTTGDIGLGAAEANAAPEVALVLEVIEDVVSGKGRIQKVPSFYLNREAALHVLMRLRTPKAVQLQVAVVRVFFLVVDARLPAPARLAHAERTRAGMLAAARRGARIGRPPKADLDPKVEHARELMTKGLSMTAAAKAAGVSHGTFHRALAAGGRPRSPGRPIPLEEKIARLTTVMETLLVKFVGGSRGRPRREGRSGAPKLALPAHLPSVPNLKLEQLRGALTNKKGGLGLAPRDAEELIRALADRIDDLPLQQLVAEAVKLWARR